MARLELRNIFKSFKKNEFVVKNISFEAKEGDFVVLVGPSGCGKTTILRMIAGLEDITSGELLIDNKVINNLPPKDRDIGMVFQNYALYPHLTVFDNIAFPLTIRKENKKNIKQKVNEVIDLIGLSNYHKYKPKELSGGQRQRVALGRAIIRKPQVFLFDEPLSNLDAKLRVQMRTEIINLQRIIGTTSIYVTHDQVEAMTMGSKLVVLNNGFIQQIGTPQEIYNSPDNLFVAGFIGSPQMNFFEGEIIYQNGILFVEKNNGLKINLPEAVFKNRVPDNNTKITLGLRPEKINLFQNYEKVDENIQKFEVVSLEYIGHETLIYFNTDGLKCCRTQGKLDINTDNYANFYFDTSEFIAFQNGERI